MRPPAGSWPTCSTRRPSSTAPADLVYTGRGSLIWLQDLDAWAAVIARLLSPAGRFVLFEGHPAEWLFDADEDGRWIATDYDYFGGAEASKGWAPEYIDRLSIAEADQSWKFARAWTLGEVITALLGADLRLEAVAEHPIDWWGGHADVRDGRARPDPAVVLGRGAPRTIGAAERSGRRQPRETAVRRAVDPADCRRSPSGRSDRRCAGTASPRRRTATGRRARRGPGSGQERPRIRRVVPVERLAEGRDAIRAVDEPFGRERRCLVGGRRDPPPTRPRSGTRWNVSRIRPGSGRSTPRPDRARPG